MSDYARAGYSTFSDHRRVPEQLPAVQAGRQAPWATGWARPVRAPRSPLHWPDRQGVAGERELGGLVVLFGCADRRWRCGRRGEQLLDRGRRHDAAGCAAQFLEYLGVSGPGRAGLGGKPATRLPSTGWLIPVNVTGVASRRPAAVEGDGQAQPRTGAPALPGTSVTGSNSRQEMIGRSPARESWWRRSLWERSAG
jgi:hypothetical protein